MTLHLTCPYCGHSQIPVVNVTRAERGYQCRACGHTWPADAVEQMHFVARHIPWLYRCNTRLAWFRLNGREPQTTEAF